MGNLFVIGIFLTFFLQFLLLQKKGKTLADKILAIWMFFIGLHLFSYYLYSLGYWQTYPHLIGITHPFPLIHGPLLYLYVVYSVRTTQHFRAKDLLHFIPALVAYLYMVPFFFFYSAEKKRLIDDNQLGDYKIFMMISLIAFAISGITYSILAYRLINRHENLVHGRFSYDEGISLNWFRYCIIGIGFIFATAASFSIMRYIFHVDFQFDTDYIFFAEIIMFIVCVGYFGIRHEGIFSENKKEIASPSDNPETKKPAEYKNSGLKDQEAEVLHQELLTLMNDKKPYLEPKLTLNALAEELHISGNYLSQLINQYQEKNFYDFVNQYRVEEFKKRASSSENKHLNILAIALDSGFNSKSSFNAVFKKHTNLTPSQYLAELNS